MQLHEIEIEKITVPAVRASSYLDEEQHQLLESSIKHFGLVQPILVRKIGEDQYELVAGKNRLDELKNNGTSVASVIVLEMNEKDSMMLHLFENLARGSTNPADEGAVLQRFLDLGGTEEELVKITGRSLSWVKLRLVINRLPEQYKKSLREKKIRLGHIELALQLPSPEEAGYALQLAEQFNWSVAAMENYTTQRLVEFEMMRTREKSNVPPQLPSEEEAREMVRLFQCSGCNRTLDVKMQRLPPLCEECYAFIRYFTTQIGEPKIAMEKLHFALRHYDRYLDFIKEKERLEQMQTYLEQKK